MIIAGLYKKITYFFQLVIITIINLIRNTNYEIKLDDDIDMFKFMHNVIFFMTIGYLILIIIYYFIESSDYVNDWKNAFLYGLIYSLSRYIGIYILNYIFFIVLNQNSAYYSALSIIRRVLPLFIYIIYPNNIFNNLYIYALVSILTTVPFYLIGNILIKKKIEYIKTNNIEINYIDNP